MLYEILLLCVEITNTQHSTRTTVGARQLYAHISNPEEQQIDPVVHRVREQTKELRMYWTELYYCSSLLGITLHGA